MLTGESDPEVAARQLAALGPELVVVKLGGLGALALDGDAIVRVPGTPVERVVDPVGAGDAFAAGFLSGRLRGFTTEAALRLANRCGALAMLSPGDMESLPRWEEVASDATTSDVRR
jgi:2-dehydro-3-deoxygluconokinase